MIQICFSVFFRCFNSNLWICNLVEMVLLKADNPFPYLIVYFSVSQLAAAFSRYEMTVRRSL